MAAANSRILILILILILPLSVRAQQNEDNISSDLASYFDVVLGVDQRLVSGSFYYKPPTGSIEGHPYYIDDSWKKGSVFINGKQFNDLDIKYDIERNKVVIKFHTVHNSEYQISLRNENIDWFTMDGRTFKPYPGTIHSNILKFCEIPAEGKLSYYILQTKSLTLSNGLGITNYKYQTSQRQYILKNSILHPFTSAHNLYKLAPENKILLKKYKRSKQLKLSRINMLNRAEIINYSNNLSSSEN